MNLRIHALLSNSRVNGPGERFVVWVRGCTHACPGCFNPETWDFAGGREFTPEELVDEVLGSGMDGLTISGGEPFQQAEGMADFLEALHAHDPKLCALPQGIILFTGYNWEELAGVEGVDRCLRLVDAVIEGRYNQTLAQTRGLAGSSNQKFRYSSEPGRGLERLPDLALWDQEVEVHGGRGDEGLVQITGFPSLNQRELRKYGITVHPIESNRGNTNSTL